MKILLGQHEVAAAFTLPHGESVNTTSRRGDVDNNAALSHVLDLRVELGVAFPQLGEGREGLGDHGLEQIEGGLSTALRRGGIGKESDTLNLDTPLASVFTSITLE